MKPPPPRGALQLGRARSAAQQPAARPRGAARPAARPQPTTTRRQPAPPAKRAGHIGVGDLGVITGSDTLVTYGLGSCVAICVYDPRGTVAGMLHFMLPDSTKDGRGGTPERPGVYADTGSRALFAALEARGARVRDLRAKLVGGAAVSSAVNMDIGARNILAAKRLLWKHGLPLDGEETGGSIARTVRMNVRGDLAIHSPGTEDRTL